RPFRATNLSRNIDNVRALLAHLLYHVKVLSAQHVDVLSGVRTVLVDNQKAAVLKNNNGKVVFNSGFLLLADHYNFLPRACRPR
ncbi:hypothetical protein ACSLOI_28030, partial [Escherichia coli]